MPKYPEAWMGELLAKNDIVSVVSEYTMLAPRGDRLWGCCPLHSEKTPSFSVVPDKQFFYCFGCHQGGGVIQFVMRAENCAYHEAIERLAQRANMELPGEIDDEQARADRAHRERLYAANKEAARWFYASLAGIAGQKAHAYLEGRGVSPRTAKRFGLGYAPEGWEGLSGHLRAKGFSDDEIVDAGLAVRSKQRGGCYDFFRDRVMFPIIAATGRVVAFGGRAMDPNEPAKYVNTGDTAIFNKRRNLYGLNMQRTNRLADLIVVEGYMDAISLVSAGVENTVATLGTAMTQQQAKLLKRYAPRAYLCYDGDAAGQNAMIRGLDILAAAGLEVKVIAIPGGMDPDDYVRKVGKEAFLQLKEEAKPLNGFKLAHMAMGFDLTKEDGREAYAKRACAFVGSLEPVERERYAAHIARMTGLALETIRAQCSVAPQDVGNIVGKSRNTRSTGEVRRMELDRSELMLAACMTHSAKAAAYVLEAMDRHGLAFSNAGLGAFADALILAYAESDAPDLAQLMAGLGEECSSEAAAVLLQPRAAEDPMAMADDCIRAIRRRKLEARLADCATRMAGKLDDKELRSEYSALQDALKKLKE